ncbi:hypothetical protein EGM88_08005 [Aureibaculum marinum]|uniref:SH3 domain-containing protein n=2 Tax=Aureibaculum marinum TaxID=2487930 RepID=A0A3N4NXZ0_9FLAO|nr:hypothetical protein EGM88_08005 [Aureibaculum marinum]
MRRLIYLIVFISNYLLSQNVTTKFFTKGYINLEPKIMTESVCSFKKGKTVGIISYFGLDWWKVNFNDCIGYVKSNVLILNDDMENLKTQKLRNDEFLLKESMQIKDSISLIKIKQDSIALINKKKDSIRIKKAIKDSTVIAFVKKGAKFRVNPDLMSELLIPELKESKEVILKDYKNRYFKACIDSKCGFINSIWVIENKDVKELVRVRKIESIARKYQESLKRIELKEQERIKQEKRILKKYGKKIYDKLKAGYYWIGMNKEMTIFSLGEPNDINKSVGSWGVHEQWVYEGLYLYFENGIVTSYQN